MHGFQVGSLGCPSILNTRLSADSSHGWCFPKIVERKIRAWQLVQAPRGQAKRLLATAKIGNLARTIRGASVRFRRKSLALSG